MRLREVLTVLAKSSPYAVKTTRLTGLSDDLDPVKDYLYIETDIELDFQKYLNLAAEGEKKIIFLCGSSGDGKSEILTRYSEKFKEKIHFHLDATHSFNPKETAIERLNKVFFDYENNNLSLVIGINTGMLGNYAEEGACSLVQAAIKDYLIFRKQNDEMIFLDFEYYPKFKLGSQNCSSDFTEKLLERITKKENNIIRSYYDKELLEVDSDTTLCTNFELLSLPSVQKIVVELLFKARLIKDQFLTTRALLDFIYYLFSGPSCLSENIFTCTDSDIVAKIADFDPVLLRTKFIDQYILRQKLELDLPTLTEFKKQIVMEYPGTIKLTSPEGFIRLFYVLQYEDIGNNFHKILKDSFSDTLLDKYASIWRLHRFPDSVEAKLELKKFYRDILQVAISKYNNKNAPQLTKDEFLITSRSGKHLAVKLDIKQDNNLIKQSAIEGNENVGYFLAHLKIDEIPLKSIKISINLLGLLIRIVEGYQPNKHDKNAVVLLDELLQALHEIAVKSKTLFIVTNAGRYRIHDAEGDATVLEVSED